MSSDAAIWLERVGLLLSLLSFVLMTPELLGAKRLRALELWVKRSFRYPVIVGGLIGAALGFPVTWMIPNRFLQSIVSLVMGVAAGSVLGWALPGLERAMQRDEGVARRWLIVGAVLFFVGTFLQFVATFSGRP